MKKFIEVYHEHHRYHVAQREFLEWANERWLWPDQRRAVDRLMRCGKVWIQKWNGLEFPHRYWCKHCMCRSCQDGSNPLAPCHERARKDQEQLVQTGTDRTHMFMITITIGWGENGSEFGPASRRFRRSLENLLRRNVPGARALTYDQLSEAVGAPGCLHHHSHGILYAPGWDLDQVKVLLAKVGQGTHVQPIREGQLGYQVEKVMRYSMRVVEDHLDRHGRLKLLTSIESIRGKSGRGMRWSLGCRIKVKEPESVYEENGCFLYRGLSV